MSECHSGEVQVWRAFQMAQATAIERIEAELELEGLPAQLGWYDVLLLRTFRPEPHAGQLRAGLGGKRGMVRLLEAVDRLLKERVGGIKVGSSRGALGGLGVLEAGEQPLVDLHGEAALEQHGLAGLGGGDEQLEVLRVAGADLEDVGVFRDHLGVPLGQEFRNEPRSVQKAISYQSVGTRRATTAPAP